MSENGKRAIPLDVELVKLVVLGERRGYSLCDGAGSEIGFVDEDAQAFEAIGDLVASSEWENIKSISLPGLFTYARSTVGETVRQQAAEVERLRTRVAESEKMFAELREEHRRCRMALKDAGQWIANLSGRFVEPGWGGSQDDVLRTIAEALEGAQSEGEVSE